jgi:hypothetical protein
MNLDFAKNWRKEHQNKDPKGAKLETITEVPKIPIRLGSKKLSFIKSSGALRISNLAKTEDSRVKTEVQQALKALDEFAAEKVQNDDDDEGPAKLKTVEEYAEIAQKVTKIFKFINL